MNTVIGNLFDFIDKGRLVIPVNIGWKSDGTNVMGKGVALELRKRAPLAPFIWGNLCRRYSTKIKVVSWDGTPYIFFPTKHLDASRPYASWMNKADISLVEKSTFELSKIEGEIYLPLVGCGNGSLKKEDVLPILEKYLVEDRFHLVLQK